MQRPEHCTAQSGQECWECHQPWLVRATECRIRRAIFLVKGRSAQVVNETESISKLEWAVHQLRELHNCQWCDMVREPFALKAKGQPIKQTKANLDDLLADIGLT